MKVIISSKSPHSSPAFLVEKEAEKRRGKKRMVVNYKALNKETLDDGYYLPKKEELLHSVAHKDSTNGMLFHLVLSKHQGYSKGIWMKYSSLTKNIVVCM